MFMYYVHITCLCIKQKRLVSTLIPKENVRGFICLARTLQLHTYMIHFRIWPRVNKLLHSEKYYNNR